MKFAYLFTGAVATGTVLLVGLVLGLEALFSNWVAAGILFALILLVLFTGLVWIETHL